MLKLFDQFDRIEKADPSFRRIMKSESADTTQAFEVGDRARIMEMIPFDEFSQDKLRGVIEVVSATPGGWVYSVRRDSGELTHGHTARGLRK